MVLPQYPTVYTSWGIPMVAASNGHRGIGQTTCGSCGSLNLCNLHAWLDMIKASPAPELSESLALLKGY
jgi:hypothetical protein